MKATSSLHISLRPTSMLSPRLCLYLPGGFFLSCCPNKIFRALLVSLICTRCLPTHFVLIYLNTLIRQANVKYVSNANSILITISWGPTMRIILKWIITFILPLSYKQDVSRIAPQDSRFIRLHNKDVQHIFYDMLNDLCFISHKMSCTS